MIFWIKFNLWPLPLSEIFTCRLEPCELISINTSTFFPFCGCQTALFCTDCMCLFFICSFSLTTCSYFSTKIFNDYLCNDCKLCTLYVLDFMLYLVKIDTVHLENLTWVLYVKTLQSDLLRFPVAKWGISYTW
jgi:hypothetical protein